MKMLFFAAPLLALAACNGSYGSWSGNMTDGQPIAQSEAAVDAFDTIALTGPDNVVFRTGDGFSVRAEGDAEVIERLRYKIDGDTLKIGREKAAMNWSSEGSATVYVTAPSLSGVKIAGSGDADIDRMSGDEASVSIAGSGDVKIGEIDAQSFSGKVAGSGDMSLAGTAQSADFSIAGSGNVSGKGLKAETVDVSVAGSGDVELSSDGQVKANVMGSGDVRVHGSASCNAKTMGSGDVNCG